MTQQTILAVDDEPQWPQLISRVFKSHGYHVLTASSCSGALEALKSNRLDCAILDFNLSDGDATALCVAIKAREGRRTPIVIFSSDPAAQDCVARGRLADRFVPKTAPLEELFGVARELLGESVN